MKEKKDSNALYLLRNCLVNLSHLGKLAIATLSLCSVSAASAQIVFPVEAPTPKVGQIATFRTVDLWNNKEISVTTDELVAVEAENLVIRSKRADQDTANTVRASKSWNVCRSMRDSDKVNCEGAFKFPMQVGSRHTLKERPWRNGQGYDNTTCEVKGEEKLTVPAGSFDTLRVVCSGFWTRVFEGNWSGQLNETIWYAPAIGRAVKIQFNLFHSRGQLDTKTQTELVAFVAGN